MTQFNEMYQGVEVRPPYARLKDWVAQMPVELRSLKQAEAEALFRRIGITFAVYGEGGDPDRLIPFDMFPRVFSGAEWAKLDPRREIFISTANTVKWLPVYSGRSEASSTVPTMFDNVMLGGADIVSELQIVQDAFQASLDKHNSTTPPA